MPRKKLVSYYIPTLHNGLLPLSSVLKVAICYNYNVDLLSCPATLIMSA